MKKFDFKLNPITGRLDMVRNLDSLMAEINDIKNSLDDVKDWVDYPELVPADFVFGRTRMASETILGGAEYEYENNVFRGWFFEGSLYFPINRLYQHVFYIKSEDNFGHFVDFDVAITPDQWHDPTYHDVPDGLFAVTKSAPDANNVVAVTLATTSMDLLALFVVDEEHGYWRLDLTATQHTSGKTYFQQVDLATDHLAGGPGLPLSDVYLYPVGKTTSSPGTTRFEFNADGSPKDGFGFGLCYWVAYGSSSSQLWPILENTPDWLVVGHFAYYHYSGASSDVPCHALPNTGPAREAVITVYDIFKEQTLELTLAQDAGN